MPNTAITVSFACMNSAQAAKMIEYFDKLNAEGMQQMCDSLNNTPEQWTEFRPDGSYGPATEPLGAIPPHVAQPNACSVSPTAQSSAPIPYASAPNMVPNAPSVAPIVPQNAPTAMPAAPQYQQTSMAYTPIPNSIPASAPVIKKEQLQSALQLFASSSPARSASVRELLACFGVDNLNALPEASYPEFANSLRGMGCAV